MCRVVTAVNKTTVYLKAANTVGCKSSHREKNVTLSPWGVLDVN